MAARTITLHAFRAGTGKTTLLANIAVSLTQQGKRIGIVDADVHAPGLHILFGLPNPRPTLNDYLWDEARLDEIVARFQDDRLPHEIIAVPASSQLDDILRMLREGFDCSLLYTGLRALGERHQLDYLLVDTPPGFHSEALIIAIASNLVLITLPPDEQDLAGTLLLLDAIRRRGEPPTFLLLNKLPAQHGVAPMAGRWSCRPGRATGLRLWAACTTKRAWPIWPAGESLRSSTPNTPGASTSIRLRRASWISTSSRAFCRSAARLAALR